ncbi:MAG: hypothetical protein U0670_13810 [Anaerolineae bacterium]
MNASNLRSNNTLLHKALLANSLFCVTSGAIALILASTVSDLIGISAVQVFLNWTGTPFFQALGVVLIAYGVMVYAFSRRQLLPTIPVLIIIGLDFAWVILSWWVILSGAWGMNLTGSLIAAGLADVVLGFAIVQTWAMRRMATERG